MDKKPIEHIKVKLLEINEFVSQLDPAIRAAAFEVLRASYFGTKQSKVSKNDDNSDAASDTSDDNVTAGSLEAFISAYAHKKPADNVALLAAWLYSNYGVYSITAKEIKELGDSCGLILPNRPDNTMRQALNKGKNLFNQQGKGWQLTVSGEIFLKETYKVKKGNKQVPKE